MTRFLSSPTSFCKDDIILVPHAGCFSLLCSPHGGTGIHTKLYYLTGLLHNDSIFLFNDSMLMYPERRFTYFLLHCLLPKANSVTWYWNCSWNRKHFNFDGSSQIHDRLMSLVPTSLIWSLVMLTDISCLSDQMKFYINIRAGFARLRETNNHSSCCHQIWRILNPAPMWLM